MSNETISNLGANSAVIEYTDTLGTALAFSLMSTFLLAHGQEHIPDFSQGSAAGAETNRYAFRSLLLDGVNYKYMYICRDTTLSPSYPALCVYTCTNLTGSGTTLTVTNKNVTATIDTYSQNQMQPGPGKIYLFATNRFFAFINYGANAADYGSGTGKGLCGVFEVEPANQADPQKIYSSVQLNTNFLTGIAGAPSYYSPVSPPITRMSTGSPAMQYNTKIVTPLSEWGTTKATTTGILMSAAMPAVTSLFNPGKHQIHEMTVVYDTYSEPYVKGRLCGIKTFTRGTGVNGDIFRVKCDNNHFLDPNGTLKDFYIIRHTTIGSFGIPM